MSQLTKFFLLGSEGDDLNGLPSTPLGCPQGQAAAVAMTRGAPVLGWGVWRSSRAQTRAFGGAPMLGQGVSTQRLCWQDCRTEEKQPKIIPSLKQHRSSRRRKGFKPLSFFFFFFPLKNKNKNLQEENLSSAGLEEQAEKLKKSPVSKGQEGRGSFRKLVCLFDEDPSET